ncbi:MAG: glycosyltransferase [Clostridium sp.]|nr:glycosyltransferase [Clostridium sp.]MDU7084661.1 glycosyltransferase [Clostridium sp.]
MNKNLLFIISDMESGGFQKSLISLFRCLDYKKYNVDLLVLNSQGIFLSEIPNEVAIHKFDFLSSMLKPFPKCINELLKEKEFILAYKRTIQFLIARIDKGRGGVYLSKMIPSIEKEYDVAIDYNGQHLLYYMVDKIKAKKKISYFHSDYQNWDYYFSADKKYYPKVDNIVTISDICKKSLDDYFPDCASKTRVVHNISSPKTINKMAAAECPIKFDNTYINIVMVGRPSEVKGYDFAIAACEKLKRNGYKIRVYAIGTSNEVNKFKGLVDRLEIAKEFIFVGETENPYTFIRQADIYLHPSRFEGKSVAIDEAKILQKPIILSSFTTAKDHIDNEVNGLIVDMSSEGVYKGIVRLIEEESLKEKLISNLKKENYGNEEEVLKFYELIEQ